MKKAKKIMSIILTLMLATSSVPMSSISVSAAGSELSATIDTGEVVTIKDTDGDTYYEIGTADELYAFAEISNTNMNLNAILTDDIVVTEEEITADSVEPRVWTPICQEGSILECYTGEFDGNGKTISGLYFSDPEMECVGFFGKLGRYARVEDLTITNSYFAGKNYIGGIAGYTILSEIENCVNEATIEAQDTWQGIAGGIAGNQGGGSIINCVNCGFVSSNGECGGIVGCIAQDAEVKNCSNYGEIKVTKNHDYGLYMGGIAGMVCSSDISNSYNYADIIYDNDESNVNVYMGGIAGYLDSQMGEESVIDVCANLGNIIAQNIPATSVGGIVADLRGSRIKDSYNKGNLTANATYVGGISGQTGIFYYNDYDGNTIEYKSNIQSCLNLGDCSSSLQYNGGVSGSSKYTTIVNCFYLDSTAENLVGAPVGSDVVFGAPLEAVDEDLLASGKITYLLNQGNTAGDQKFYQTLGEDPYPSFTGKTVYCNYNEETGEDSFYNEESPECEHEYDVYGFCVNCGVECEHNFVDGYCEICYMECAHSYDENSICVNCGAECGHDYDEYGFCINCGAECAHDYDEYGFCVNCGAECAHFFWYGYCDYCGKECEHNFVDGYCEICYMECAHSYDENGICGNCGAECEHSFWYGYCDYCGKECEHSYDEYGWCVICSAECTHTFTDGVCDNCGMQCEHIYDENSVCEYCGKECEHNYDKNSHCEICGRYCENHNFVDGVCTFCNKAVMELNSAGLTITGNVGVNLIFKLDDKAVADKDAYFEISVPCGTNESGSYKLAYETQIVKVSEALKSTQLTNGYMLTCYISAKEFSSDIITTLHLSDGTTSQPIKYQAKNYLEQTMKMSDNDPMKIKTQKFVKALLNYSACAQYNFNYFPNGIANDSPLFTEEDFKLTTFSGDERTSFINNNTMTLSNTAEDQIKYYGSSLLLENNTVIRHYFTLADASVDVSTFNVTVDGKAAEVNQKGNVYYVDIENISPKALGDTYTVKISTSTGTMTINYSCMTYVASILNKYTNENGECINSSKQTLVNLVASLYDYYNVALNM